MTLPRFRSLRSWPFAIAVPTMMFLALVETPARAQQSGSHLEITGSTERLEWTETRFAVLPFERPVRRDAEGYAPTAASSDGGPLQTLWTSPVEIVWDFGDDSTPVSTGERVSVAHRYEDEGSYTIRVTAADEGGVFAEGRHEITITNNKPRRTRVAASPAVGVAGAVDFKATAQDSPADTLTYLWDFGDGETDEGEDLWDVRHTYSESGDFTVTLLVRDEDGGEAEETTEVEVRGVVEAGAAPAPIDPDEMPETVIDGLKGRVAGGLNGILDAEVRSLRGLYLSPISSGACRFMFTAWDDALLAYAHVVVDFPHLPAEGGKYRFSAPVAALVFEPTASHYLFNKKQGLGAGGVAGLGAVLEGLLGGEDAVSDELRTRARDEVGIDPSARETPDDPPAIPAFSPLGLEETARFLSKSGTFDLTFLPGRYALGTLNLGLEPYNDEGPTQGAGIALQNVSFALDLNAARRDGMLNYSSCDDGILKIDARSPKPDTQHVLSLRPPVRVSFDRRLDPTTISEETFQVAYPDPSGELVVAAGRRLVAGYSTTFVPDEPLKAGVRYTTRVKTGKRGVRGLDGSELDDTEDDGWQKWEFTSRLDFVPSGGEADQLLACHLFQTVRDPRLIAGKPALARAFAHWSRHADVQPEAQVRDFEARVILTDRQGRELASTSKIFVRPDLWAERGIDTVAALHTAQVYGFEPSDELDLPLRILLEVPSGPGEGPELRYRAVCPAEIWDRQPTVTVDYFAFKIYDWEDSDAFAAIMPTLRDVTSQSKLYAEQLFPIAKLDPMVIKARAIPEEGLPPSPIGWAAGDWVAAYRDDLLGWSTADIVVALVPDSYFDGGSTTLLGLRGAIVMAIGDDETLFPRYVNGLVHEMGHALTLPHLPVEDGDSASQLRVLRDSGAQFWFKGIEGFRLSPSGASGWNKSSTEGNEEDDILVPLMFPTTMLLERAFISHHHYLELQRLFDERGD